MDWRTYPCWGCGRAGEAARPAVGACVCVCVCGSRRKEKESQLTKKTRDNREDTTLHSLVDRYTREGQAEGNEDLPRRRREGIGSL